VVEGIVEPLPWSAASAAEIAQAAGAADLFVFRRVADRRFAHIGGVGRGAGWAGIVEVGVEEERLVGAALSSGEVVRWCAAEPRHVLGPYYGRAVAVVPVDADLFVVFGAESDTFSTIADPELLALARFAGEALVEVEPAKRLADELEVLHAVQELLHARAETFPEGLQALVDQATAALSCDLGVVYVRDTGQKAVCDRRGGAPLDEAEAIATLDALAERRQCPVCVQSAVAIDLPAPFRAADGVLAYYLLEIERPLPGMLLLLHTTAGVPRGFTLLCQSLGAKLVTAAEPLLAAALLRDGMTEELTRVAAEARRDALTGLANRLAWNEALEAARPCANTPASIVQVDCRGLKAVNENRGHHAGDQLLCRVASILSASVREGDLVARLGGDEFAILLCGADEYETATVIARMEARLADHYDDTDGPIRLAIGSATARDVDLATAHQQADAQMLRAKRSG
jgi:diguanylate cyclase (GGDEF)-like protein